MTQLPVQPPPGAERSVLVTGGAGFIGTHTCVQLLCAGYDVTVLDNLCNSSEGALRRVEEIAGRPLRFIRGDIRSAADLDAAFKAAQPAAVIHFAGLKAVGESLQIPLDYYDNNIVGTVSLLAAMRRHGCQRLVFSSSATVYGEPEQLPLTESARLTATNPYGRTKLFIEEMLRDFGAANPAWKICMLRYFNPVGAHPSGRIGEAPHDVPNNLMPYIMQVAVGRREFVSVFGNDYTTPDGTGVRDYIHVMDLADGHVAALRQMEQLPSTVALNLGTGKGYSVLDVIKSASAACGREVSYRFAARRPGDVATVYCDPSKAAALLGWRARMGLTEMCRDAWNWQRQNPNGFADDAGQ